MKELIFVVGPTGTGKSDLAVELAEALGNSEIINGDSVQFYRGVDVGTAKPSAEMLERIPHHLLSFVDPPQTLTAADFARFAHEKLSERATAGVQRFFIVGGSGFYIQAFEKGMYALEKADPKIAAELSHELESGAHEKLWQELQSRDPEYSKKIAKQDTYRLLRALELLRSGVSLSMREAAEKFKHETNLHAEKLARDYKIRKIGLDMDRGKLRDRMLQRTRAMLANHWVDEVRELRARGLGDWPPLKSIGYFEIGEMLDGRLEPSELEEKITVSSMQLAKRQRTWFKRDPSIHWLTPGDLPGALEFIK